VCAYGCASDATITIFNGEASLAARVVTGPPAARRPTDLRPRTLDFGASAGAGADALASADAGLALRLFAAALLRAPGEDAAFGAAGFVVEGVDGLRVPAAFRLPAAVFAVTVFFPLSLSGTTGLGFGAGRFFSGIRTMLPLPLTNCQGRQRSFRLEAEVRGCQGVGGANVPGVPRVLRFH
jgi:hypothetical protein